MITPAIIAWQRMKRAKLAASSNYIVSTFYTFYDIMRDAIMKRAGVSTQFKPKSLKQTRG